MTGGTVGWIVRLVAAGMVLVSFSLAFSGLPVPRGDDAFYKSPGAELALNGVLRSPSAIHYLPRVEEIYVAYPPLYPYAFAGWTKLAGFDWTAATLFSHVLHLAATLALVAAAARMLAAVPLERGWKAFVLLLLAAWHWSNLRFLDRQEDLALLFFWLAWAWPRSEKSVWRVTAIEGLAVGMAGFVGPFPGMLAATAVALRHIWELKAVRAPWMIPARWALAGAVAILPLGLWVLWMERSYPGLALEQFRAHVGRVPHVSAFKNPTALLNSFRYSPFHLPLLLLFGVMLFGAPRSIWGKPSFGAPLVTAALGLLTTVLWRADSYVYLWASLALALPCLAYLVAVRLAFAESTKDRAMLAALAVLCTLPTLRDPVTLAVQAWQMPASERPPALFAKIAKRVPPGEIVAITPRHWHLFQNRNPWRQAAAIGWLTAEQRREAKYVVLPYRYGGPAYRKALLDGYQLIEESPPEFSPWKLSFPEGERGWDYEIWERVDRFMADAAGRK